MDTTPSTENNKREQSTVSQNLVLNSIQSTAADNDETFYDQDSGRLVGTPTLLKTIPTSKPSSKQTSLQVVTKLSQNTDLILTQPMITADTEKYSDIQGSLQVPTAQAISTSRHSSKQPSLQVIKKESKSPKSSIAPQSPPQLANFLHSPIPTDHNISIEVSHRNYNGSVRSKSPEQKSPKSLSIKSEYLEERKMETDLETREPEETSVNRKSNVSENKTSRRSESPIGSPVITSNIDKIANMSKVLSNEAKALRQSIRSLSEDIAKTKQEMSDQQEENVNFPYHLFLLEIIVNKIHMKCDCFDVDGNNLVILATFLGKQPIVLYDTSYGKIYNFTKLNLGKSILFAMTYDKICSIKDFEITIQLTKQPPCTSCVTKIGQACMDLTVEFVKLREELCRKWLAEQPDDNIMCTTSTPLSKNLYHLSCGDEDHRDSIGVIEVSTRMSFLGKEIMTSFCATPKPQGTSFLLKQDNGMTMYSCQKVEMDDQGKILLDESSLTKKSLPCAHRNLSFIERNQRCPSPTSSILSSKRSYQPIPYSHYQNEVPKYDEIFTKINANELKIRVPKTTKVERMGKYDRIQELCSCENTPYNTGDQIQFQLPKDFHNSDTYTSNLKYTHKGYDNTCDKRDRKILSVTPTNCPVPVAMEKILHPQKDVFVLKIGKKLETKDKKTELEIELVTPKGPTEKRNLDNNINDISQQCSTVELNKKQSKTSNKKKNKTKKANKSKKEIKSKNKTKK
ncbi:uncharacterized protein LOC119630256 [Bombyx mori]|uniref:uncharacterized protein LOC119630256 n=1 Tax=Bombyx mori TaxID=7091 RepID=UPI002ED3239D